MRKRYTAAFKAQVVQEVLRAERTITQIASEHGVHPNLIGEWKAAVLKGPPTLFEKDHTEMAAARAAHEKQLDELYSEIGLLTTEGAAPDLEQRPGQPLHESAIYRAFAC